MRRQVQFFGTRVIWLEIAILGLALLLIPTNASAYIDAGMGSTAYQTILAMILGWGYLVRRAVAGGLFRRKASKVQFTREAP